MNVMTRGMRNAFRNAIRAFSLIAILGLSIGLALSMLIAYRAVDAKITSVKASVGNTVSISPAGLRGFEGGGTALTETQLQSVATMAHVTAMSKTLSDRLTTTNTTLQSAVDAGTLGRRFAESSGQAAPPSMAISGTTAEGTQAFRSFTPPISLIGSTTPTNLTSGGGGTFSLTSGKVFAGTSTENVAVVGKSVATKNNLQVGSTFTAYSTTVTVVGIFDAGNTFANNQVIMPLASVQKLTGQAGAITAATVTVDSITNVTSVTAAVQKVLGTTADVTNASTEAQTAVAPLENIKTISLYSLIGAIVAGSVIILLTMIMIVRERRREIGVIKAIGASDAMVVGQFMVEALTLTVLAAVVGVIFGVLAGNPITKMLVTNASSTSTTTTQLAGPGGPGGGGFGGRGALRGLHTSITNVHAIVGWDILLYGLGAAIVIALIGSGIAAFFIAKVRPMEVMRAE